MHWDNGIMHNSNPRELCRRVHRRTWSWPSKCKRVRTNGRTNALRMWSNGQRGRWRLCETGVNSSPGAGQTNTHTDRRWEASCYPGDLHGRKEPWKERAKTCACVSAGGLGRPGGKTWQEYWSRSETKPDISTCRTAEITNGFKSNSIHSR